ncbi:peptidylprolyl isomerase [Robbsia sp. Bb-Pol-6]|uniref:peptidylprolyl isomerase n=1 Tax=Robbsia betulipollinis TaxID=2981849 RepID=A0ABT3ZNL6_9BURK|nr:peptidylprolyl isomerase [Robbsia betulipollinis]MCY0388126.1 peptidylprolyl isomerase [Robbsia betulipollinis]
MILRKTRQARIRAGLAGAALLVCAPVFAQNVAIVNGTPIPSARADALLKTVPPQQGQADPAQLRQAAREELINREVLMQEAVREGVTNDPDVKQQMVMASQAVAIRAMLEKYLQSHPITDAELQGEYQRAVQQVGDKEVHLHHILVDNEQQAKDLIAKIKAGGDFDALAKQYSKDTGSAKNGGDLDWANPRAYVPEFGAAATQLKKGEITDTPVHTQFGWHIIRLDDVRQTPPPPFDAVKAQLAQQRQKAVIEQFEAKLRAQAKIQ